MNTYRKNALIVGILYIIGTVAGVLSVVFTLSILDSSNYLSKISDNENKVIIGALFVLVMGFSLSFMSVYLYPVLKKFNQPLAMSFVVFRGALETFLYIAAASNFLLLTILSREYVKTSVADPAYFKTLGELLQKGNDLIATLIIIVFSLGAFILYYLLFKSKLVPRWISIWGLVAITLHFATSFLILFHVVDSDMATIIMYMNAPIFFQEMVMAGWLIVKGFNRSVLDNKD
jgi:hypothetical protein